MLSTTMSTRLDEAGVRINRDLRNIKKGAAVTLFPSFEHLWNYLVAKQEEEDDLIIATLTSSHRETTCRVNHGILDYKEYLRDILDYEEYLRDIPKETMEDFLARIIIDVKQKGWIR